MKELIEACEGDLRAGRISQAATRLRGIKPSELHRDDRRALANLCRRAEMDIQALKILAPVVRPDTPSVAATPDELAEYAAALLKIGAVNESLALLSRVDPAFVPSAHLFTAFGHVKRWAYKEAIPRLEAYLASNPAPYMQLVGKVNLAAAYAAARDFQRAQTTLEQALAAAEKEGHRRLAANCREIRAQIHIFHNRLSEAREDLKAAALELNQAHDGLLIRKWQAVLEALETKSAAPLNRFREEATAQKDWETLREVDFFQLKVEFDSQRFHQLLFGTPFAAYRERIVSDLKQTAPNTEWVLGSPTAARFHVVTGEIEGLEASAPGNTIHQLVGVLLSDLYKPWSIGSIFSELFPTEYFDVFSSPNRVHQLLWRLRRWFESNSIPVALTEHEGQYRLEVKGDFSFVLPQQKAKLDEQDIYLRKIQSVFGSGSTFSSREVQAKLGISSSSFKRLASWALENKKIERMGASRSTVYRIVA